MGTRQWSRSRYWLCHFLQNRHERLPVTSDEPCELPHDLRVAILRYLDRLSPKHGKAGPWLVYRAALEQGNDPAYVQALRLMHREQHYHEQLTDKLADRFNLPRRRHAAWLHRLTGLRHILGTRFEMSVLLLDKLIDTVMFQAMAQGMDDPVINQLTRETDRDIRGHIVFCSERLTREYADFHFVRRNLRRWRLRLMFLMLLLIVMVAHRRVMRQADCPPLTFARRCWSKFSQLLERMVPYQRQALLAALLNQRRYPFQKAWTGK